MIQHQRVPEFSNIPPQQAPTAERTNPNGPEQFKTYFSNTSCHIIFSEFHAYFQMRFINSAKKLWESNNNNNNKKKSSSLTEWKMIFVSSVFSLLQFCNILCGKSGQWMNLFGLSYWSHCRIVYRDDRWVGGLDMPNIL